MEPFMMFGCTVLTVYMSGLLYLTLYTNIVKVAIEYIHIKSQYIQKRYRAWRMGLSDYRDLDFHVKPLRTFPLYMVDGEVFNKHEVVTRDMTRKFETHTMFMYSVNGQVYYSLDEEITNEKVRQMLIDADPDYSIVKADLDTLDILAENQRIDVTNEVKGILGPGLGHHQPVLTESTYIELVYKMKLAQMREAKTYFITLFRKRLTIETNDITFQLKQKPTKYKHLHTVECFKIKDVPQDDPSDHEHHEE